MSGYQDILNKLNDFIKKYYTKMLIKGTMLFFFLGLLYFIVVLGVEYLLWLNTTGRLILLIAFISVELFLLFKYILTPIFYLFKLKKGISNKQASVLIGRHFSEVDDKLFNLLDLAEDSNKTELLMASLEQRSNNMYTIPFTKAVNFRESLRYVKYLGIPLLILALIWISGNLNSFFGSYERVVNYDLAYEPPAPFTFILVSEDLNVLESEEYHIYVRTEGKLRPEDSFIVIEGKEYLLQEQNGLYHYVFVPPLQSVGFYFMANGIKSKEYRLNALRVPSIQNFEVVLDYPDYTNKSNEVLQSTGNASFPEGTEVKWEIVGHYTDTVRIITKDTVFVFQQSFDEFKFSQKIYANMPYQVSTSNSNVRDHETLDYQFKVIKDAYPIIKVEEILDSLNPNISYYLGSASDDYKLSSIKLVYYRTNDESKKQVLQIGTPYLNYEEFYYTYPSGLELIEGQNYSFYFEVTDNDGIHKGKTSKSRVFSRTLLDSAQLINKNLGIQQGIIGNMDKSLEEFSKQKETLREIKKNQKEKNTLNFNDKNQVKKFLQKQQQQEELMQKFSSQLKENLDKGSKDNEINKLLKERLARQEKEAQKNAKLLEELNKIADKIDKEELTKRLEELGKQQLNKERSLEQLLELTKRYYVTEKASQLAKDLMKLSEKQKQLSKKDVEISSLKQQESVNTEFNNLAEELEELKKDNQDLKKPLDLKIDKSKEVVIKKTQDDVLKDLMERDSDENSTSPMEKEKLGNNANKKQKSAAEKIKQMSDDLQKSSAAGSGGSTISEDAEMLRQILDNLVVFSFKQEQLYNSLEITDTEVSKFTNSVKQQNELKSLFKHVDDSLFALSLRRVELSEFINEQITEVYYNMDKALESMAENRIYQGVSFQQYVLTASNNLADFLANILDNMQQSLKSGSGSGKGEQGFQLPDIIKGQGKVNEKMGQMGESGKKGEQEGEGDSQNGKGKEGKNGEAGNKEGDGKDGKNGRDGSKQPGEGQNGNGQGQSQSSEQELLEIYEIYKEQQKLREQLEHQLEDMINAEDKQLAEKLIKQMEDFEKDLLENGVTQRTLNKVNNIEYQLMKLEKAVLKQGKKPERESNRSTREFQNPITTPPVGLEINRNEIEILNRQALPLQQIFQNKVKNYFNRDD